MVGRQTLHLSSRELHKLLGQFGYPVPVAAVNDLFLRNQGFAEPLFHLLGAESIRSLDASDYEHATDIVDLNAPIDESYKNIFSVVIDSGSLEHVFNFPVAIKSCMQMVEPGGYFIGVVPGNNFLGHGFYQFSPELFYRIFTQANGFAVIKMFVFEDRAGATWFEVA
ncbi:MAG: class I SAM-dependent methyltransferase, partial [Gammaproteobacteria bacterium]